VTAIEAVTQIKRLQ